MNTLIGNYKFQEKMRQTRQSCNGVPVSCSNQCQKKNGLQQTYRMINFITIVKGCTWPFSGCINFTLETGIRGVTYKLRWTYTKKSWDALLPPKEIWIQNGGHFSWFAKGPVTFGTHREKKMFPPLPLAAILDPPLHGDRISENPIPAHTHTGGIVSICHNILVISKWK